MTTSENLPRFDKPAAGRPATLAPAPSRNRVTQPDAPREAAKVAERQSAVEGYSDLHASRLRLLAGRECKLAAPVAVSGTHGVEPEGHVARMWHICPGCFPDA